MQINSNLDSVIFFTTHKCASTYLKKILNSIDKNSEYSHYDYGSLVGSLAKELGVDSDFETYLNKNYKKLFNLKGEIYGPQRMPLRFKNVNDYKIVFFLRDPRDVLVSAYYSFAFNHKIPDNSIIKKQMLDSREKYLVMGLDKYVISQVDEWVLPVYKEYIKIRNKSNEYLFLKYEDFTYDPLSFTKKIYEFLDLNVDLIDDNLIDQANPVQKKIEEDSHQRSGKNKQWLDELKPETIRELNFKLEEVLNEWEFVIE